MSIEKCACHIVLPDGTKVALKDSYAREELTKKVAKITDVNVSDLGSSNGFIYGGYKDGKEIKEGGIVYGVTAGEGDIVQRGKDGNIALPTPEKIIDESCAVSVAYLKEALSGMDSLKYKLFEVRNSAENNGATRIYNCSNVDSSIRPFYIDIGFSLDGDQSELNYVRIPYSLSAYQGVQGGITTYFDKKIESCKSLDKYISLRIECNHAGDTFQLMFTVYNGSNVSKIRIEKVMLYYL